MTPRKYEIRPVNDGTPISVPQELTPEEEAEILAQARTEIDPVALEGELCDLLRQRQEGKLVSIDELMRRMQDLEDAPQSFPRNPA